MSYYLEVGESLMGFRSVRVSDLSGEELDDLEVVNVVVRHPNHEEVRQFDASAEELKLLKTVANLVSMEYRLADGTVKEVFSTASEFSKVISDEKFLTFDSNRGRRKGFRPSGD